MAVKESLKLEINSVMPDFVLKNYDGTVYSNKSLMGERGLLVVFTCNHCPYAKAVWPRLLRLSYFATTLGINTVAINPNLNPEYPEDSPAKMKELVDKIGVTFPYLIDTGQFTAKAYKAQCTPDIYLLDNKMRLVYHGRFDDNWRDEAHVIKEDLRDAIKRLAEKKEPLHRQYPSMGCSIKWTNLFTI